MKREEKEREKNIAGAEWYKCLPGDKPKSSVFLDARAVLECSMSVFGGCIVAPPRDSLRFEPPMEFLGAFFVLLGGLDGLGFDP
jgi:hypothetical protein